MRMTLSVSFASVRQLCAGSGSGDSLPFMGVLRNGLGALCERSRLYDTLVGEANPFRREFTAYALRSALRDDDWFCVFECLVIFIRIRQLSDREAALSVQEQAVLDYFENCGEWAPEDESLVSRCYWNCLPAGRLCQSFEAASSQPVRVP